MSAFRTIPGACPFAGERAAARLRPDYAPPNLRAEYKALAGVRSGATDGSPRVAAKQTTDLLNRLFYPLVLKLHESARALSPNRLANLARSIEREAPVQLGRYEEGAARVGDRGAEWSQDSIKNSVAGARSNGLDKLSLQLERFVFRRPRPEILADLGTSQQLLALNLTPIGPYGETFAKEMALTAAILVELTRENLEPLSRATFLANHRLLRAETARAAAAVSEGVPLSRAAQGTMAEGVISVHQVLGHLLSSRIPGASTGREALRKIVFDARPQRGLTTDFTARTSMGVIAPAVSRGSTFKDPVRVGPDQLTELNAGAREELARMAGISREMNENAGICPMAYSFRGEQRISVPGPADAGEVPIEKQMTGVQLATETYWHLFKQVHALRLFEPRQVASEGIPDAFGP